MEGRRDCPILMSALGIMRFLSRQTGISQPLAFVPEVTDAECRREKCEWWDAEVGRCHVKLK